MITPKPGLSPEYIAMREMMDKFRIMYYYKHMACPKCGSVHLSTTYMGIILNHECMESYKDTNEAKCSCGWSGIVHDLKGHV